MNFAKSFDRCSFQVYVPSSEIKKSTSADAFGHNFGKVTHIYEFSHDHYFTMLIASRKLPVKLATEIYTLTNENDSDDGFVGSVAKYLDGENGDVTHVEFDSAGFHHYCQRRVPNSPNEVMLGCTNGFRRVIVVRFLPMGESTPDTRREGLRILRSFLTDPRFHQTIPPMIDTRDLTNESHLPSLDEYFMDDEIWDLLQNDFGREYLNADFYKNFEKLAKKFWQYKYVPEFARSLGFPGVEEL